MYAQMLQLGRNRGDFQPGDRVEGESVEKFYRIGVSQGRVVWQKIKPPRFRDAASRLMERQARVCKYYFFRTCAPTAVRN